MTIVREAVSFPPSLEPPGSLLPGGSLFSCQRCIGGQVFYDWGKFKCLQCSAEHLSDGQVIKPRLGSRPKYDFAGKRFKRYLFGPGG